MAPWKIAGVQMDCRLGDGAANLDRMRRGLQEAADQGARLIVFPECALTGYGFDSREEAWPHAEALPGPSSETLAADCRRLGVSVVFGLLERDGDRLFNACALVGRAGFVAAYRKVHLPCMGVDRFATPGDRPFAVHDLGGLRVGMNICYDGSFPESARVLALLGADLIVLPTNWPMGARAACHLPEARALENHVYYLAVNRAGEERGFRFVGRSRLIDYRGEVGAVAGEAEEIVYGVIEPEKTRDKRVVVVPGKHEVDRVGDRRPEMYRRLCE
ncbi:MAG TPA: carbon-nitrogen hydrolase family protein [Gemmataceae bacterium]|nr:carbon-nitrogen hydrolase family protein [Gemmataceae bacterium]